ncbi:ABC transporter ATP-binding protein [Propionibacteriaceae bacterium Y1923]|uniref:ABC transporter ATP-binding protein n=1 Tax=Aestuariimicrobium sp. Y1814 TaxID=3418742 RepID=UPI003C191CC5
MTTQTKTTPQAQAARLVMSDITKRFGDVLALDDIDLTLNAREVHGLLGGNGAGKTTLMNILYGLYKPDEGTVTVDGERLTLTGPKDAIKHGIGMVHQNFLQVDTYTVLENIVLGTDQPTFPKLDLREAEKEVERLSQQFGLAVKPRAVVGDLPVGIRQRVEILKALYRGAKILALDEPTTNLTPQEVDDLFASLRKIVDEDMSVVFITHKIKETMAVCDRLTVMREGRRIGTVNRADTDPTELAAMMVGDTETDRVAAVVQEGMVTREFALSEFEVKQFEPRVTIKGVSTTNDAGVGAINDVTLDIGKGEVVGIAGVAGNGQVELAEAIAGVRPLTSGVITVDSDDLTGRPTRDWLAGGVAYVAEDRHRDGILPSRSLTENVLLGHQRRKKFRKHGLVDWSLAEQETQEIITKYKVKASGPSAPAATLSGGNIQRVILARAFGHDPRLLILHNPTRGLDIASTQFVYDQVRAATAAGTSVLLISEDLDELTVLADRINVLFDGALVGERSRGNYDPYELGRLMAGLEVSA